MSVPASALLQTSGYLVADARGRLVGRVECPMYGTEPDLPDALAVRRGFFTRRRWLVPAAAIDQIDGASGVTAFASSASRCAASSKNRPPTTTSCGNPAARSQPSLGSASRRAAEPASIVPFFEPPV